MSPSRSISYIRVLGWPAVRPLALSWVALLGLALAAGGAHAQSAPTCAPSNSTSPRRSRTVPSPSRPRPDSLDASYLTQISFLGVPAAEIADVSVSGSRSGNHSGRLERLLAGRRRELFAERAVRPGGDGDGQRDPPSGRQYDPLLLALHPRRCRRHQPLPGDTSSASAAAEGKRTAVLHLTPGTAPADGLREHRRRRPDARGHLPGPLRRPRPVRADGPHGSGSWCGSSRSPAASGLPICAFNSTTASRS